MIYYGTVIKENINKHNLNWPRIADYSYKLSIIWSVSDKTNTLLNLIKQQDDGNCSIVDKICLYGKDANEKCTNILSNAVKIMARWKQWLKDFYWIFKWHAVCP